MTFYELVADCMERAGWRVGPRIARFVGMWAVAEQKLGHPVGPEEFVSWSPWSSATVYRRLAEFRAAFPEHGQHATPSVLDLDLAWLQDAVLSGFAS